MVVFDLGYRLANTIEATGKDDLERLAELSGSLVGFLDPGALAQRTAVELYRLLGLPLVSVAVRDPSARCAMRGVLGARTDRFRQVRVQPAKVSGAG